MHRKPYRILNIFVPCIAAAVKHHLATLARAIHSEDRRCIYHHRCQCLCLQVSLNHGCRSHILSWWLIVWWCMQVWCVWEIIRYQNKFLLHWVTRQFMQNFVTTSVAMRQIATIILCTLIYWANHGNKPDKQTIDVHVISISGKWNLQYEYTNAYDLIIIPGCAVFIVFELGVYAYTNIITCIWSYFIFTHVLQYVQSIERNVNLNEHTIISYCRTYKPQAQVIQMRYEGGSILRRMLAFHRYNQCVQNCQSNRNFQCGQLESETVFCYNRHFMYINCFFIGFISRIDSDDERLIIHFVFRYPLGSMAWLCPWMWCSGSWHWWHLRCSAQYRRWLHCRKVWC